MSTSYVSALKDPWFPASEACPTMERVKAVERMNSWDGIPPALVSRIDTASWDGAALVPEVPDTIRPLGAG